MKRLFKAFKKLKPGEKPLKDSEFPADYSSVHAGQDDEHQAHSTSGRYHSKPLVWLRPHEMTGNGTALLFEVGDVNVGSGFNANVRGQSANYCLLLCLAQIGNRQDLLHSVIPPGQTLHGKNYDGSVRFIFRQFGQEFELTIDDRLPTINGELAFSGTHRGQFWLCLLEKAFAKLFGSYEDVPTCASLELLPLLTGGVCEEIYVREIKVDDLLKILQSALKRELIVEAFCARNESSDDAEKCMKKLPDLPPGGHYIISGTAQVPRDGSSIDVVKILDYRRALLDQEYTRLSSDWYQLQANATEEI
ncbi:hypothetical protein BOX15_Mlig027602g1 [Macrostomum lignano]|uniref:Calpain catalytic domain-containing protein n=1 Tax=Macrostomum lignano TaxID=282301 RepID=A0A267EX17_9PLAT|nr:hypothetical protein BOX15_Mlig027602g1 [Macrostomum lignano]